MQQDENFKTQQRRRKLLSANGCVGGGGGNATGSAAQRSKARESMLNVTISTGALMPSSNTMFSGVAGVAARVLGDPCEASEAARVAGVGLVAGLVNTTASPDNELAIDAAGSTNMLAALSNAVTPAEDGDENAAAASEAAAAAARQLMATRLGPSLPEENPVATNATKISYVASRLSPSAERARRPGQTRAPPPPPAARCSRCPLPRSR